MPTLDRADIAAGVLTVVGFVGAAFLVFFVPSSFTGPHPGLAVILVLTVPIFPYAAYWALSISRALAVRLYRRQAFGIGFVVLALWFSIAALEFPSGGAVTTGVILSTYPFYFLFITLFYWTDASVLASRRSDPLLRDTLYWTRIRKPVWVANVFIWGVPLAVTTYAVLVGDLTLMNQLNAGTFGNSLAGQTFSVIYNILPMSTLICGAVYLPAIALRQKWDRALRMHFLWFTPTAIGLLSLFFGLANASITPVGHLAPALVLALIGYTLFRSAKALVPLNRISLAPAE